MLSIFHQDHSKLYESIPLTDITPDGCYIFDIIGPYGRIDSYDKGFEGYIHNEHKDSGVPWSGDYAHK